MRKRTALLTIAALVLGVFLGQAMHSGSRQASNAEGSPALAAWEDFMQRMVALGNRILADDLRDTVTLASFPSETDRDRAEGFRQLVHMVAEGLRWEFDHNDPAFPSLMVINTDTTGWGGPNVDNKYLRASIDSRYQYRLSGNIADARAIAIQTAKGEMHAGVIGASETVDQTDLALDAEGNFELVISQEEWQGPEDWMPFNPEHTLLTLRVYYLDWETDGDAAFHLTRIGAEGMAPEPMTEAEVATRIARAADWVEGSVVGWNRWMKAAMALYDVNQGNCTRSVAGGSSALAYGGIPFELQPDEALIIEFTPPETDYWSFQTYTHAWFDAGDYANRMTSLNMEQAYQRDDGSVWIVVAHEDPGIANWIDTEGRREAVVTHRWLNASSPAEPRAWPVPFSELRQHLPDDIPEFTPEQRREQIAVRQRAVQHRFHN